MEVTLVNTLTSLKAMLSLMVSLPTSPPSIYIDAEGTSLGRHGRLSLLQVRLSPLQQIFIVDVHVLQQAAFWTTPDGEPQCSLKSILESETIPKVIFDVRNDSDALFSLFQIRLACVRDLQLMEFCTRSNPGRFLNSLAKCIEIDLGLPSEVIQSWKSRKEQVRAAYISQQNNLFLERPLSHLALSYAAGDVEHMPALYAKYRANIYTTRWDWVVQETSNRILLSQSPGYESQGGKERAIGPALPDNPLLNDISDDLEDHGWL